MQRKARCRRRWIRARGRQTPQNRNKQTTRQRYCKRYVENKDFKSQNYYQLEIKAWKAEQVIKALSVCRYNSVAEAEEEILRAQSEDYMHVNNVAKKVIHQEAPLLYDLTSLQKEANQQYGYTAEQTLGIAQWLYEAKLISYPRTGSRYLSKDVFDTIPTLLESLSSHHRLAKYAMRLLGQELNSRSVDDKKVTDHHALIITGHTKSNLNTEQQCIFDMIACRMLEALSETSIKEQTTISMSVYGVAFEIKSAKLISKGWKEVKGESKEDEQQFLDLRKGDKLEIESVDMLTKQTKALPIHTESSLLSAMETCGKDIEDAQEREAIKDSGIGTPATRASIIETLIKRDYITRHKKQLIPTTKGLLVYQVVKDKRIADVAMTGEWEKQLVLVEQGKQSADDFTKDIEVYAHQITSELLNCEIQMEQRLKNCPKCEKQSLQIYPKVAKCIEKNCEFILFRTIAGKQLSDSNIEELLTKGKSSLIRGFKSKHGKSFDAKLVFDTDYKLAFQFSSKGRHKR